MKIIVMIFALIMGSSVLAAERYVPSAEEVEAYKQAMSATSTSDQLSRSEERTPSASDRIRGIAMGVRMLDLNDDDTAQALLTVTRYGELEQKSARQIQSRVCEMLEGVDDVRTVNPSDIAQVFDDQTSKIEQSAQSHYDRLMGKLSPKGVATISKFLDENLRASNSPNMADAFTKAGSPIVPLFAMQERCNRTSEIPTVDSTVTGATK